jgi:hypothetical protein
VTFLTWGYDDQGIMEQNIIIHDLDWDWIAGWVNLQLIYNVQTGGDKNQKSLSTAMENFGIEQTRTAHDALGDAYNTALVCTHLDMDAGLDGYDDAVRILSARSAREPKAVPDGPEPVAHDTFPNYISKAEAFSDGALTDYPCPVCGAAWSPTRWVNQGDQRYMNMFSCPEDGAFLVRVKVPQGGRRHLVRKPPGIRGRRRALRLLQGQGGPVPAPGQRPLQPAKKTVRQNEITKSRFLKRKRLFYAHLPKYSPRALGVALYLREPAPRNGKFPLVPEEFIKLNPRLPVVKVAAEIQNIALHAHGAGVADRGTHAHVGHGYVGEPSSSTTLAA